MFAQMHACMNAWKHAWTLASMHERAQACMNTHRHAWTRAGVHEHLQACMNARRHPCRHAHLAWNPIISGLFPPGSTGEACQFQHQCNISATSVQHQCNIGATSVQLAWSTTIGSLYDLCFFPQAKRKKKLNDVQRILYNMLNNFAPQPKMIFTGSWHSYRG